jgi:hypothetical protein
MESVQNARNPSASKEPARFSSSKNRKSRKGEKQPTQTTSAASASKKAETHRVRMTAGGDKLECPGDPSSPTVLMLNAKIHVNSPISDANEGARHLGLDISNCHLGTPMDCCQCMRVQPWCIPQEVWDDPNHDIHVEDDGFVCLETGKGMHGLKEAGVLAFNQLVKKLAPHGCAPMPFTPGLWRHKTKRTTFVLCVDDFGVKCFTKDDALHLIHAPEASCSLTIDWDGKPCCGLNLDWHCDEGHVDVSMDGHAWQALIKFGHPAPRRAQHAPHKWIAPVHGSRKPQNPTERCSATKLNKAGAIRVQSVNGTFMCHGRGVDPCILVALNDVSTEQAAPTAETLEKTEMPMDHPHTCPNAVIRFHASDMILKSTTDAAYLVLPKARSRAAVHHHLGWEANENVNGPVDVFCSTMKNVEASGEVVG